jgi:hypothetical protein
VLIAPSPAALRVAAIRALPAFDAELRRGRYAAAQLWKLTAVKGHYLPLGDLIAPYLGDAEAVVPYDWLQIFRRLGAFRRPVISVDVAFHVYAEEVRGMTVKYATRAGSRNGRMPDDASRLQHFDVAIVIPRNDDFLNAWRTRFGVAWPMVRSDECHPLIEGLLLRGNRFYRELVVHNNRARCGKIRR